MVTLDEAMHGSVRPVTVRRNQTCAACGGTGVEGNRSCRTCGGAGEIARTETCNVKVPAGVGEGQRLRVPGRGDPGGGGAAAGDLFLRVRLARHPDFEVENHNLVYELPLAPWEAVLGVEVAVPTLTQPVNIRIPPGTQPGQKLRVRGRGLPDRSGGKGDLIVVVGVEVPAAVSPQEKAAWERLARESDFNPRG
jgi:curved DNA-binding protein